MLATACFNCQLKAPTQGLNNGRGITGQVWVENPKVQQRVVNPGWPRCTMIPGSYILVPCSKLQQHITHNSIAAKLPNPLHLKSWSQQWHLCLGHFVVPAPWHTPLALIHSVLSNATGFCSLAGVTVYPFIVQLLLCLHTRSNVHAKCIRWILQRRLLLVSLHHRNKNQNGGGNNLISMCSAEFPSDTFQGLCLPPLGLCGLCKALPHRISLERPEFLNSWNQKKFMMPLTLSSFW